MAYSTSRSSITKALIYYATKRLCLFGEYDTGMNFEGLELVYLKLFEMNQQQSYKGQASTLDE